MNSGIKVFHPFVQALIEVTCSSSPTFLSCTLATSKSKLKRVFLTLKLTKFDKVSKTGNSIDYSLVLTVALYTGST